MRFWGELLYLGENTQQLTLKARVHGLHSTATLDGDVDRPGGERCMSKFLLRNLDWQRVGDRVARLSRPHSVWACLRQTLNPLHIALPPQPIRAVAE